MDIVHHDQRASGTKITRRRKGASDLTDAGTACRTALWRAALGAFEKVGNGQVPCLTKCSRDKGCLIETPAPLPVPVEWNRNQGNPAGRRDGLDHKVGQPSRKANAPVVFQFGNCTGEGALVRGGVPREEGWFPTTVAAAVDRLGGRDDLSAASARGLAVPSDRGAAGLT
jgi:hypothetical protein